LGAQHPQFLWLEPQLPVVVSRNLSVLD